MSEVLPAAASTALRATLSSPVARTGHVLAAFPPAVYVGLDDPAPGEPAVIALVTCDGIRLPNALAVAPAATDRPLRGVDAGQPARVGRGSVDLPALRATAARWWDPRPSLHADHADHADHGVLQRSVPVLAAALAPWPCAVADRLGPLALAVAEDDGAAAAAAADGLLGLGPGLTPAGDDVLAGALATLALLAPAGVRTPRGAWAALDATVGEMAGARTTALSAALLGCARRGQVAAPVADLLRALTGDGGIGPALERLVRVGHSSGRDLAAGILLAAQSVAARPTAAAGAVA